MNRMESMINKIRIIGKTIFPVLLAGMCLVFLSAEIEPVFGIRLSAQASDSPKAKFKILHVMSYHSPWAWTDEQLAGFKEALKGLNVEYKVFQMDTKRKNTEEEMKAAGRQARDLIDSWKPDLVYTSDDNVQEYVAKYYVNTALPFVFSAVNADPEKYGFAGSKNITGILEQEHFVASVTLLREIAPGVKKIAVVLDEGADTWDPVVKRMKAKLNRLPDVEFVRWDVIHSFNEYKRMIEAYQTEVDAIALLGIFTFKDESGRNVPYAEVLKWTAENSRLPDFSFWKDRISYGTLCTVTVSGFEQGMAAGVIARGILTEGRSPSSFPMVPTVKGEPVVSLARAKRLNIPIKTSVLLTAEVVEKFAWEK